MSSTSSRKWARGRDARLYAGRIARRIRRRRGRAAALPMAAIAAELSINERVVQACVKWLVEQRHIPIGTSPDGYFWITTPEERRAVRDALLRRAVSTFEHAQALDSDAIVAPLLGQLRLHLEGRPR